VLIMFSLFCALPCLREGQTRALQEDMEVDKIMRALLTLGATRALHEDMEVDKIMWFICESCAILSLQGVFVRVVLLYHYMVYL
jgi:hypothetical protein